MSSRLEGADADAWLCANLAAARPAVASDEHFAPCVASLAAALGEVPDLPAPTLALDVALLLAGVKLSASRVEGPLAGHLRGYEDHLLARLVADRRWLPLQEAWLSAPASLRPAAAGLLVARLLERLGTAVGTSVSQAAVRRLATRPADDAQAEGQAVLAAGGELAARLGEACDALARASRQVRALLSDAEVQLLENIGTLEGLAARVALAQLADVAQELEAALPARIKMAPGDGEAPTALEEESAYPVGGWSSITNQGTPESLVTSELVFMDDAARPDLFDLRFVEGELLYYARDESVALRKRRTLALVFDASLEASRLVDAGGRYQRVVLATAAAVAVVRRLSSWLAQGTLQFELVFVRSGGVNPLASEAGVAGLLLKQWRERGRLEVREDDSRAAALERLSTTWGPRADVVLLSAEGAPLPAGAWRRGASVRVAERPGLGWSGRPNTAEPELPVAPFERWVALTRALLAGLLG